MHQYLCKCTDFQEITADPEQQKLGMGNKYIQLVSSFMDYTTVTSLLSRKPYNLS